MIALVLGTACGSSEAEPAADKKPETGGPGVLSPLTNLSQLSADADPLSDHRPSEVQCNNLSGWYLEDEQLEVNTGKCNYLALSEPAAVSAPQGALVSTQISYFDLTASEPAEAHVALLLGSDILWEKHIPIPGSADVLDIEFKLPKQVSQGDPIGFHLHNHGQNTYDFEPLSVSETLP